MNFGQCCIPGCKMNPEDDSCRMGADPGFVLCYPHAGELTMSIAHLAEWPERAAAIEAWVTAHGGLPALTQLRPQAARGFR